MFTDAYSLLLSRLEERARQEPAARREVRSNKKARELYDVLTKWAPYVDFDALLFTVRAADLADPGASQRKFEAPADDDSWCTFEDVVGDVENPDSYFSGSC